MTDAPVPGRLAASHPNHGCVRGTRGPCRQAKYLYLELLIYHLLTLKKLFLFLFTDKETEIRQATTLDPTLPLCDLELDT